MPACAELRRERGTLRENSEPTKSRCLCRECIPEMLLSSDGRSGGFIILYNRPRSCYTFDGRQNYFQ